MPPKPRKRRVNAKGRNAEGEQFIPLTHNMARSPAFRSLGGPALKVWAELRSRYNGYNNGQLSLSFAEAAGLLHMSKTTVARAFRELETKGFIRMRVKGQWYGRRASEWIVTDRSHEGALATRDWQRWSPPKEAKKQKPVSTRSRRSDCAPAEDRGPELADRLNPRHPALRVIDGSA